MSNKPAGQDTTRNDDTEQSPAPIAADPDASPLEPPARGLGQAGAQGELEAVKDAAAPDRPRDEQE